VIKKQKGSLNLQVDEMRSIVKNKRKKQCLWIAFDRNTRKIVGLYIEERSKKSASMLWQSLPPVYRLCAVCYTDFWEYYSEVLPFKRQRLLGKESGKTSHNERLNNTLRQRIYRLVRKTLSFSKNCFHHIGALFNCGPHYNFCIRKRYPYCA
jgi:insertion element IS1 protein InsB